MRPVAADANAQRPRRATLALRLPHRMQQTLANAFEVAVGAPQFLQIRGQGILDILVLAAAAFQDQLYFDLILLPLLEWITGVPAPRLSPLFSPVIESTEFGRSLPRFVASATAARIAFPIAIWFTPTGVWT